ncbi:MAG: hypothetical protein IPH45_13680 [Bacteroidales bacterium]|nr:hypothetical protein [Bacteroidales bacterium]MBK7172463.1 hypothetical protein [Bacteroidales bacterium]
MNKKISIFLILLVISATAAMAQKTGKITIKTKYTGIVEGYDHTNKTQLYVDGKLAGESSQGLESVQSDFTVSIPRGKHSIRIINLALYEGNWEEHTKENNYSIDALYESDINLKKKMTIDLTFDIEKEETRAKVK